MNFEGLISWYQSKIGNYDKQFWEKSIEQRILQGLESRPKKESTLNTNLLDVDLIRGTAFVKSKPKHNLTAVLRRGFLHSAFATIYWGYWSRNTSFRIAAYIMLHFFLQLTQVSIFLLLDPQKTHVTEGDVFVPLLMGLCLGVLHSQLTSAHGSTHILPLPPSGLPAPSSPFNFTSTSIFGSTLSTKPTVHASKNISVRPTRNKETISLPVDTTEGYPSSLNTKSHSGKPSYETSAENPNTLEKSSSSSEDPFNSRESSHFDERANEADDDSFIEGDEEDDVENDAENEGLLCKDCNKYRCNSAIDRITKSNEMDGDANMQTALHRCSSLHCRKRAMSGDLSVREQTGNAAFRQDIPLSWIAKQLSCGGHDADAEESDDDDVEDSELAFNIPENTPGNGKPKLFLRKIIPSSTGNCTRKRSNSLSSDFCYSLSSKFSSEPFPGKASSMSTNNACMHEKRSTFSVSPPPEDILKRFKEAKLRGVPDPEVFAEYDFEPPQLSLMSSARQNKNRDCLTADAAHKIVTSSIRNNRKSSISNNKESSNDVSNTQSTRQANSLRRRTQLRWEDTISEQESATHINSKPEENLQGDISKTKVLANNVKNFNQSNGSLTVLAKKKTDFSVSLLNEIICSHQSINDSAAPLYSSPSLHDASNFTLFGFTCVPPLSNHINGSSKIDSTFFCNDQRNSPSDSCLAEQMDLLLKSNVQLNEDSDGFSDDTKPFDTFTSRRRQRAKFLQLFWERANRQRRPCFDVLTTTTASTNTALLSLNKCKLEQNDSPPILNCTQAIPTASVGLKKLNTSTATEGMRNRSVPINSTVEPPDVSRADWQNTISVSVSSRKNPQQYRSAVLAPQKWSSSQNSRTKVPIYRLQTTNGISSSENKNLASQQRTIKGQNASETEYDRMNSDIGSDNDSSSESEADSQNNDGAVSPPLNGKLPNKTSNTKRLNINVIHQKSPISPAWIKENEEGSDMPSSLSINDLDLKGTNTSAFGAGNGTTADDAVYEKQDDPFLLWYMRAFQGISDYSSAASLETVWCYIWEGEKVKKVNLTLLDIGWSIIQAVERQPVSFFYPKLSCIATVALAVLPVLFHTWYTPSFKQNVTIGTIGPLSEFEFNEKQSTNPNIFDSPATLMFAFYFWISSALTDVIAPVDGFGESSFHRIFSIKLWLSKITRDRLVIGLGVWLRLNIYGAIFFLLCVAERTFQQRLMYAKHFFSLTSGHRARKCRIPHFRLNKVAHVKCWLTLRSYLKKQGPQRSVENIITAAFYLAFTLGLFVCAQLLVGKPRRTSVFLNLATWDILACTASVSIFLLRFLTLGTKITKKYRNLSVLITEQINLYLSMEKKEHKKEEIAITNQVLRLAECLLKEVDGPYRICGWAVNPLVYNVFKLVLLSCFSALVSEFLGFKLKLYKLKLNPANW